MSERYDEERRQGVAIAGGRRGGLGGWTSAGRPGSGRAPGALHPRPRGGSTPGVRCLELGCGTGEFTIRLVESGCELVAVDISEVTAAICRERVGPRVEVVVGDIRRAQGSKARSTRSSA